MRSLSRISCAFNACELLNKHGNVVTSRAVFSWMRDLSELLPALKAKGWKIVVSAPGLEPTPIDVLDFHKLNPEGIIKLEVDTKCFTAF